jgi:aromatic-L-amino-acid decarboxylase
LTPQSGAARTRKKGFLVLPEATEQVPAMGFDFTPFEFDADERQRLGQQLIQGINDYFSSLPDRPVQLPAERRNFRDLEGELPELGQDAAVVLGDAMHDLVEKGFHVPSANYFGLMNPTPTYMAVLSEALVATLNPQLASLARSQFASRIERETVRWIADRVGWTSDQEFDGTFTSGGNEANLSALALALHRRFPQVKQEGVASLGVRPVLYASAESHHSLEKAAVLLGLGQRSLRRIPVDGKLRIDMKALAEKVDADVAAGFIPLAVIATAGTTNSGAIDPIRELVGFCRERHIWLHVDGAYGAALVFSNAHRDLLDGISEADSVTMDPHKWLAMPFAAGMLLTRHGSLLEETFGVETAYMPRIEHHDPDGKPLPPDYYRISTQWSRRMNSLKLWLTLRVHGRQAYEDLMTRQMELARLLEQKLESSGLFEVTSPGPLPIVNVRLRVPPEMRSVLHRELVADVTGDGEFWISTTRVCGESVVRMMVISYLTQQRHVERLAERIVQAARLAVERAHATA